MDFMRIAFVVFVTLVREHTSQMINNGIITANVYEEQKNQTALAEIDCTPVGGVRVDLVSVEPNAFDTPCRGCFAVFKLTKPNYELFFLPSQGSLSYAAVSHYNITVSCTNGTSSTSTVIRISVTTNEPPFFDSYQDIPAAAINVQTAKNGDVIYTVTDARDPDGDTIFYNMTVGRVSSASKYEIGLTSGKIIATTDLSSECFSSQIFYIYIYDSRHAVVGPKVVTLQYNPYYEVPHISNLNKDIYVFENLAIGQPVGPATITATDNTGSIDYVVTTSPSGAEYLFEIDKTGGDARLLLRNKLDYESILRRINVTIKPTNNFCTPDTFYLYINVIDTNDPPVVTPRDVVIFRNEGNVTYNPGWLVTDEDQTDGYSFSIVESNVGSLFTIDYATGIIRASSYDIDGTPPANPTQVNLTVRVTDTKGPDSVNTTVSINIVDINDNPPVMASATYAYQITDCIPAGVYIGDQVVATDTMDSAFNGNNVVECIPNNNTYLRVLTTCRVLLIASIPANTVSTLYVRARDLGTVPSQQTSAEVPFIVTSMACPTTTTVTTPTTTATTTTTTTTVTTTTPIPSTTFVGIDQLIPVGAVNGDDGTGNIWWIVIASIVGLILLACAGFFISRYILPRCQGRGSKPFKPGSGVNNKTEPGNNQRNQPRSNAHKNVQPPVSTREVKPYEPKQGPDDYRKGNISKPPDNRGNYQHKQNVWHGMGPQPGKGFDL